MSQPAQPTFEQQFIPTNANLELTANRLEQHAKDSLESWTILGQVAKYEEAMEAVSKYRQAMTIKGLRARREYLGWN